MDQISVSAELHALIAAVKQIYRTIMDCIFLVFMFYVLYDSTQHISLAVFLGLFKYEYKKYFKSLCHSKDKILSLTMKVLVI